MQLIFVRIWLCMAAPKKQVSVPVVHAIGPAAVHSLADRYLRALSLERSSLQLSPQDSSPFDEPANIHTCFTNNSRSNDYGANRAGCAIAHALRGGACPEHAAGAADDGRDTRRTGTYA